MAREPTGWAVDEYVTAGGKNRVLELLKGFIGEPKAEAMTLIKLLKERGNLLRMPHSKRACSSFGGSRCGFSTCSDQGAESPSSTGW